MALAIRTEELWFIGEFSPARYTRFTSLREADSEGSMVSSVREGYEPLRQR